MRVLHIIPSLLPESGGPARIVPELCRALATSGVNVTLFSAHLPGKKLTIDPAREPYEVVLFTGANGSLTGARRIHKSIRERSSEFDLIHIHSLWNLTTTLSATAARKSNVPYIIAPMGMLSDVCLRQRSYALKRSYAWALERQTVEGAAGLHLANEDELRTLHKDWFQYPPHFFARNALNLDLIRINPSTFREQFPELIERPIMLSFGRLHAIKGLDIQLQALARLLPKYPDLVWVLVGPDAGEWQRLNSLIYATGLESNIKWLGPISGDDRFSALANADVLVQTSFYECQSMAVNEALAVGVPLVVTDSINYGEVQSVGAGFVVSRKPAAVANAIDEILASADRSNEMRAAGRRFALEELSRSKVSRVLREAYDDILLKVAGKPWGSHVGPSRLRPSLQKRGAKL